MPPRSIGEAKGEEEVVGEQAEDKEPIGDVKRILV